MKKRRGAEIAKVAVYGERETDLNMKREATRLQRQREEKENKVREEQIKERERLISNQRQQEEKSNSDR